jgi:hypothetical protein
MTTSSVSEAVSASIFRQLRKVLDSNATFAYALGLAAVPCAQAQPVSMQLTPPTDVAMSSPADRSLVVAQIEPPTQSSPRPLGDPVKAAREKVGYEVGTDMPTQRFDCMTGEEAGRRTEFVSIKQFRVRFLLSPVDICLARQDLSVQSDLMYGQFDRIGGILSPYSEVMRRRGNGSIEAAKLAIANYKKVIELLRAGETREEPDGSITFSIGNAIKPLKLTPGLAFDLGFVSKTAGILEGTEGPDRPVGTDAQLRREALACISNNASIVKCYELGVRRANLEAQAGGTIPTGALRSTRSR